MFSKETQNLADSRDFYYELICPVDKHCRDHAIKHKFKMVCSPGCIKYSVRRKHQTGGLQVELYE